MTMYIGPIQARQRQAVRFSSEREHYTQRDTELNRPIYETPITPQQDDHYVRPGKIRAGIDTLVDLTLRPFDALHFTQKEKRILRETVREVLDAKSLADKREYFSQLIPLIDNAIRVSGTFTPFAQRRAGRTVLDLLAPIEEANRPFEFILNLLHSPEFARSHSYLLSGLHDHPAVALKPRFWTRWNTRLAAMAVDETYPHRRLLSYHLLNYLQRSSHEMMVLTKLSSLMRQSLLTQGRLLSQEEALALRNVLVRTPEGSPERQVWYQTLLEPPHYFETSEIQREVRIPAISKKDQDTLLIHLDADIKILKEAADNALSLLNQTLHPRKKAIEGKKVIADQEEALKRYFFLENLMSNLQETTAGTHFPGIQSVMKQIPFPQGEAGKSTVETIALNQMIDLLAPASPGNHQFKLSKPYRLVLAQLLHGKDVNLEGDLKERLTRITAEHAIQVDTSQRTAYDPSHGVAIHRRLDEAVMGLTDAKACLTRQWERYVKGKDTTRPIIFLDGNNGTGKTSTLKRFAIEMNTTLAQQMSNSTYDYWYGDKKEYDPDFGIVTHSIEKGLNAGWTEADLRKGALKQLLIEQVNNLQVQLRNTSPPGVLIVDELSKTVVGINDPKARLMVFDALAKMIVDLAETGHYIVPGTENVAVTLPPHIAIGITANYSRNERNKLELAEQSFTLEDLKTAVFNGPQWKTPHGQRLLNLVQDKTFITGQFSPEEVSNLVDVLVRQSLPYITALKSSRVRFENLQELQKYYLDQYARNQNEVEGRVIARAIQGELFEAMAVKRAIPGSTFNIRFDPDASWQKNQLVFDIENIPPVGDLSQF